MPSNQQRMTARRIDLASLTAGDYHKREGFDPNFVLTPTGMRVSRASVIGTVVDTYVNDEGSYGAITIDDGSDVVRAKLFQDVDPAETVDEGDIVELVGKVRFYDEERYIQPELIVQRSVTEELVHRLEQEQLKRWWKQAIETAKQAQDEGKADDEVKELLAAEGITEEDTEAILTYLSADEQFDTASTVASGSGGRGSGRQPDEDDGDDSERRNILRIIDDLDDGDGAGYNDIIEQSGMSEEEVESVINDLLSDGTCYEPKPGKIKKL